MRACSYKDETETIFAAHEPKFQPFYFTLFLCNISRVWIVTKKRYINNLRSGFCFKENLMLSIYKFNI